MWLEPMAAAVVFALSLFMNRSVEWPWMWVIDVIACSGAALSYRKPALGAFLTALSLVAWLPFETTVVSTSGMVFYVNVFAAARKSLRWKIPLVLGLSGLAYLTLVRKAVELPSDQLTTSILLLVLLALTYGGGVAYRYATHRIERERETGEERLQNLQVSLARELHDSVAQTLSSAAMRANIAMSDPGVSELTRDQMEKIAEECRSSAHDLRQLLSALRDSPDRTVAPGPLADVESLKYAVHSQADRLRAEGFTVDVDIQLGKLSAARCQTLAAIAVEASNNMIKHARPRSECVMSITTDADDVHAQFTNAMKSTRMSSRGLGLTGIKERLALLNGTFDVSRRDGLWALNVKLPLGTEGTAFTPPSPTEPHLVDSGAAEAS